MGGNWGRTAPAVNVPPQGVGTDSRGHAPGGRVLSPRRSGTGGFHDCEPTWLSLEPSKENTRESHCKRDPIGEPRDLPRSPGSLWQVAADRSVADSQQTPTACPCHLGGKRGSLRQTPDSGFQA